MTGFFEVVERASAGSSLRFHSTEPSSLWSSRLDEYVKEEIAPTESVSAQAAVREICMAFVA